MEHKLVNWLKFATMSLKISLSTQAIANLDQHNWNCSIFKIFFRCISLSYSIPFLLAMTLSYLGKHLWYDLRTANISRTKRSNPLSVMFWPKLQRFECEVNNIQIWHFISCLYFIKHYSRCPWNIFAYQHHTSPSMLTNPYIASWKQACEQPIGFLGLCTRIQFQDS